jgi:hypothetical protein
MPRTHQDDQNDDELNPAIEDDQNDDAGDDDVQDDDQSGENAPPAPPAPREANGAVEYATMTDREKALVTQVRNDEKRKQYKEKEKLQAALRVAEQRMRELESAPPAPTPRAREAREDKRDELVSLIREMREDMKRTNDRIERMESQTEQRERQKELDRYAKKKIDAIRAKGENVILALVGGETEADIDEAIEYAHAEWVLAQPALPANGRRTASSVTVQQGGRRRPAGTPPVQVPNSVDQDENESINELTSDSAVRNGDYKKNRTRLLGGLKRSFKYVGQQE